MMTVYRLARIPSYKGLPHMPLSGIWLDLLSNQRPLATPPISLAFQCEPTCETLLLYDYFVLKLKVLVLRRRSVIYAEQ